jgi:hypothetical protein
VTCDRDAFRKERRVRHHDVGCASELSRQSTRQVEGDRRDGNVRVREVRLGQPDERGVAFDERAAPRGAETQVRESNCAHASAEIDEVPRPGPTRCGERSEEQRIYVDAISVSGLQERDGAAEQRVSNDLFGRAKIAR